MVHEGALNAAIFLKFLCRLVKDADRKLFVIQAIVSVGGFLRMGNAFVEEPFAHLGFRLSANNRTAAHGTPQQPSSTNAPANMTRRPRPTP